MGLAGWRLEGWHASFPEAVGFGVAFAHEHGRPASTIRDHEYTEPRQVWMR
jgi:hypothetical protein